MREAAADLDMDDGLDPAQNTQLLVLRCLMALSAADAFSHATLQQPLPVNWVLDQILQPSAVALQYYAGSSPSKEAWRLRSGVMQQRALAMQVGVVSYHMVQYPTCMPRHTPQPHNMLTARTGCLTLCLVACNRCWWPAPRCLSAACHAQMTCVTPRQAWL